MDANKKSNLKKIALTFIIALSFSLTQIANGKPNIVDRLIVTVGTKTHTQRDITDYICTRYLIQGKPVPPIEKNWRKFVDQYVSDEIFKKTSEAISGQINPEDLIKVTSLVNERVRSGSFNLPKEFALNNSDILKVLSIDAFFKLRTKNKSSKEVGKWVSRQRENTKINYFGSSFQYYPLSEL